MPRTSPYARFATKDLTLRDALAVDRTVVANERTFLGYIRTTLGLLAAGASLLHFLSGTWPTIGGILLIGSSVPMFGIGLHHYIARRRSLTPLMGAVEEGGPAPGGEPSPGPGAAGPDRASQD